MSRLMSHIASLRRIAFYFKWNFRWKINEGKNEKKKKNRNGIKSRNEMNEISNYLCFVELTYTHIHDNRFLC